MRLKKYYLFIFIFLLALYFVLYKFFVCKFDISSFRSDKIINSQDYEFLVNSKICNNNDDFLVAIVCISVDNFKQRKIIRQTWSKFDSLKTVFLLGRSLNKSVNILVEEESKIYMDLVQQDFIDSYFNLTLKTIMGLKWISQFCPNVKYVLKIDDDVVVNTPVLISYLKSIDYKDNYYMGSLQIGAPVDRNQQSKWAIYQYEYSSDCYPYYHQGPAYLFSGKFAPTLYNISQYTKFFKLEDVYMGMLAYQTNTNYVSLNGYYLNDKTFSLYQAKQLTRKGKSKFFAFTDQNEFMSIWNLFQKLF